jgi:hypothetical protein
VGPHLKHNVNPDGSAQEGGQPGADKELLVGPFQGRAYSLKAERPGFIHPSAEPLRASIELQQKLEDDIRKLVHLAVQNKTGRSISADIKELVAQGIESGLAHIGLILETAERRIADYWACYEENNIKKRQIAHVKYPDRFNLTPTKTRIEEAQGLAKLMVTVPGRETKKELAKDLVTTLLGSRLSADRLTAIYKEIDECPYTTSDPDTVIQASINGLVGEQTASMALGFNDNEYLQAQKDHQARIERIAQSQTQGLGAMAQGQPAAQTAPVEPKEPTVAKEAPKSDTSATKLLPKQDVANKAVVNKGDLNHKSQVASPIDPNVPNPAWAAARGAKDLAVNRQAASEEKAASRDTTLEADKKQPVRGKGKKLGD